MSPKKRKTSRLATTRWLTKHSRLPKTELPPNRTERTQLQEMFAKYLSLQKVAKKDRARREQIENENKKPASERASLIAEPRIHVDDGSLKQFALKLRVMRKFCYLLEFQCRFSPLL